MKCPARPEFRWIQTATTEPTNPGFRDEVAGRRETPDRDARRPTAAWRLQQREERPTDRVNPPPFPGPPRHT
ncbi:hypothetical protein NQZ68_018130 [Dissostichus eleginoides]|nr:hypothetical protein NQZ68_018072 [Dissostichus eleginoides]KAI9524447.1 hypothetical protein NQZ68_018130 [Dissostichus eleginoides]